MARNHARIYAAIWQDEDFTSLPAAAQRAYMLILSQPGVTFCGVVPYTVRRWASKAPDTTVAAFERAVLELEGAGFIVVDREAEELLIRQFVKHDGVADSPNLRIAMWKDFDGIFSPELRRAFLENLPEKCWEDPPEGIRRPLANGSGNPSGKGCPTPAPPPSPSPKDAAQAPPVDEIFTLWQAETKHPRAVLDSKRRARIEWALKTYPREDVEDAVRGAARSKFHQGDNQHGKRYDDIELICRDAKHLENFRDEFRNGPVSGAVGSAYREWVPGSA